jgi:hypothetical protein
MPPFPFRIAPLEGGSGAIGASNVQSTEGVVQPTRLATLDRDLVWPRGTIEIALEISREPHDDPTIRIKADAAKGHRRIKISNSPKPGAIRSHPPEICRPISITFEHDGGTVRRPSRIMITAWMAGESRSGSASEWNLPEIPSPTEDNCLSIRADARESRKVDVPFCPKSAWTTGNCQRNGGRGKTGRQKADRPRQD